MSERHVLGGRTFLAVRESTVEQDFRFLALIKRAQIDEITMRPEEGPGPYAQRLLEATVASGAVLDLLGCLLIPEEAALGDGDPGEAWTRETGEETARFLGRLREPADKAKIQGLVLSLLVSFFESGIVSLSSSTTSSGETVPNNGTTTEANPAATDTGPNSSSSSPAGTTTARSASSAGLSESPSRSTAGG